MGSTFIYSSFVILLTLFFIGCNPKGETVLTTPKEYESCCGLEPVEYRAGDAYMYVPNIFTPNGDGVNDFFVPVINDQISNIDSYLIYTGEGDTVIFHRPGFDFSNIENYAWNGLRHNVGDVYKGRFKYQIYYNIKDGTGPYLAEGYACRLVCGPDVAVFKDKEGCFYPNQVNSQGRLDASISNQEERCFR